MKLGMIEAGNAKRLRKLRHECRFMNLFSSELIEESDRLLIRPGWIWRFFFAIVSCFVWAIVAGWWFITAKVLSTGWYFQDTFFSAKTGMGLGLAIWFGLGSILMLVSLVGISSLTYSIHADGWVRTGLAAWRFPGPIRVRYVMVTTGRYGSSSSPALRLAYGAFSLDVLSFDSKDRTMDLASRADQWARRQMGGTPASGRTHSGNFMRKWVWIYLAILAVVAIVTFCILLAFNHRLNEHAAFGVWAIGAAAGFAVVGLTVAGSHWAGLARREIKTGATIWVMDVLAVLLLIAAGCAAAAHAGQIYDMYTRPAHETTLHQPMRYFTTADKDGKNCRLHLRIMEPEQTHLNYDAGPCDGYWKNATSVEVHQLENELGVRILSVRRVDAP